MFLLRLNLYLNQRFNIISLNIMNRIISALDIGSNSIHGVICEVNSDKKLIELFRTKYSVRLGNSIKSGIISESEIQSTINAINDFKSNSIHFGGYLRAVATSAIRDSLNKDEFINKIFNATGVEIEVINGTKEAELIYKGISSQFTNQSSLKLLIDIGGGSTEIIICKDQRIIYASSLNIGAVRLSQLFFTNSNLDESSIDVCKNYVNQILSKTIDKVNQYPIDEVWGSSGTIQTIGLAIMLKKGLNVRKPLNLVKIDKSELTVMHNLIESKRKYKDLILIDGIEESRAEVITAGSIIFKEIIQNINFKHIIITSYALREGIIFDTIENINN